MISLVIIIKKRREQIPLFAVFVYYFYLNLQNSKSMFLLLKRVIASYSMISKFFILPQTPKCNEEMFEAQIGPNNMVMCGVITAITIYDNHYNMCDNI